jgi:hypothetical protein
VSSIIPKEGEQLKLYQGSTFDETWEVRDPATPPAELGPLVDLTDWKAGLTVRATYAGPPLLELEEGTLSDPPEEDVIVIDPVGTLRLYVTDETMATLAAASFVEKTDDDGNKIYVGVWDLELENPDGERFRYVMGDVLFSLEATY